MPVIEMAYALSSETGSATPIRPLLSVNSHSVCVRSSSCVHCPIHVTPSACLLIRLTDSAPPVHATTLPPPPMPRSPILIPARFSLPSALRIRRTPPQIVTGSTPFPSKPSRLVRRTPKPSAQDQASPHRISRQQKCKTPLLYIARVAHRPWPSSLEVWTSSQFRRMAAVYGFAQDIRTLFVIPLLF